MGKQKVAIFGSGAGTNAQNIINYFKDHPSIEVSLIVSNKPNINLCQIALDNNIPLLVLTKEELNKRKTLEQLDYFTIDLIVLAGFLLLVPKFIIKEYEKRIINIHPALLPKFGGKGMYGMTIHEAVIKAKEKESGITIHYVNELFDEGEIIFQAKCYIHQTDNINTLSKKIKELEHKNFPVIIEKLLLKN